MRFASLLLASAFLLAPLSPALAGRDDRAIDIADAGLSDLQARVSQSYDTERNRRARAAAKRDRRTHAARARSRQPTSPWGPFAYPPGLF
jgi:hypothetical protein